VYFEGLRKSNPEIDQAVVEHTFFLQQMSRFEDTRQFKSILNDTHIHLAENGLIKSPKLKRGAKVVSMFSRYKRTVAIAASVAGITMLCASALVWSLSPGKNEMKKDIDYLGTKVKVLEGKAAAQENEIKIVKGQISMPIMPEKIAYTPGGTSFLVDTKGYLVTNAHVVAGASYIAVQNSAGKDFRATVVYADSKKDIAILKIVDTSFKAPSSIPYAVKKSSTDIAEPIFSLGYPRKDIVYGEGYMSANLDGDTLAIQISIDANRGNSGSPVLNKKGEVIGVLNAKQTSVEGVVFAVQSRYIYDALSQLKKADTAYQNIKLPTTSNLKTSERTEQVKKISDFVYMVKVN